MQDDCTALITASVNGHHKVVELLLRRDADIEASDRVRAGLGDGGRGAHAACKSFPNGHYQRHTLGLSMHVRAGWVTRGAGMYRAEAGLSRMATRMY